jgi:hypothetical protein
MTRTDPFFVVAALLFFSLAAGAVSIPRELPLGTSDFSHRSLGEACFAMDAVVDGLPCNPAFTAKERKSQFQTHIFFGNNVSYIRDVNDVLNNEADQKTIERLFNQRRSSEMEASIEAGYLHEKYGFEFTPYRLTYYSLVRNSSLPVITLYAGEEQSARTQLASYVNGDFFFGVQLRAVQRKFILSEFALTDALVEDGKDDIFKTQDQRAVYFEPGMLWFPEDQPWSPQFSLVLTQLGAVDHKYDELPASPELHLGGSVKPPIHFGELELGTNLSLKSQYEKWTDLLRFAVSYTLGATQYVTSFTENQYALSFLLHYKSVRGGLTYDYKRFENLIGEMDQVGTVYLQVGIEI